MDDLNFDLHRGEILGILGPNGAGKSTVMQLLAGNLAASSGTIQICGVNLREQPREAKSHLGYLPEIPPLYPDLTVREYLGLAARLHGLRGQAERMGVDGAVERCGLGEVAQRLIGSISKGYQQRTGVAQAMIHSPPVLLLDEPTSGLDPLQIRDMRALIKEFGKTHSVVLSTHILPDAEALCDRILVLKGGRTLFCGAPQALRDREPGLNLEDAFVKLAGSGEAP